LNQHIQSGHGFRWKIKKDPEKNKYPCEFCGKPCKDNYHARQHALTHLPKVQSSLYPCNICDLEFSKIKEIREHYAQSHPKHQIPKFELRNARKLPIIVRCPDCPEHIGFTSKKMYNKHIKNGHGKNKKGKKSFVERGLPPPVRKKKHTKKKKSNVETDYEAEEFEIKEEQIDSDEMSIKDEPLDMDSDSDNGQEWILPEEVPVIRSRRGRIINPSRNLNISTPGRYSHDGNIEFKDLRVVLPRCD